MSFFARRGTRYQIAVAGTRDGDPVFQRRNPASDCFLAADPLPAWEALTLDGERISPLRCRARSCWWILGYLVRALPS